MTEREKKTPILEVGGTQMGRRAYPDEEGVLRLSPGDYGQETTGEWCARPPTMSVGDESMEEDGSKSHPLRGTLRGHKVEEHPNGSITVSPSILISYPWGPEQKWYTWHGFLEKGVWRRV